MMEIFQSLPQPLATIIAAFLGFFCGTIMSHKLSLRREDTRTKRQMQAAAVLIASELKNAAKQTQEHVELNERRIDGWRVEYKDHADEGVEIETRNVVGLYPVIGTPAFQEYIREIGLLPTSIVEEVTGVYQTIATWNRLEEVQPKRTIHTYVNSNPIVREDGKRMAAVAEHLLQYVGER